MLIKVYSDSKEIDKKYLDQLILIDEERVLEFINDPFTFNVGIVLDDEKEKVLGFGLIRVVNEVKMILNPELSNTIKARVLKYLLDEAKHISQCNEVLAEITRGGDHYIDSLVKHFNFYETSGKVLRFEK